MEHRKIIFRGIKAEGVFPSHEVERGEQTIQTEDMVAMKMADKDVVDLSKSDSAFPELHLCSFAAVD